MEHPEVEVLFGREMPHAGHECLPERPIISPFGKGAVDGGVMDGRVALGVVRHGQALPLHAGVEHRQDEVEKAVIAQFALRSTLRHREVRQDKFLELRCGELHGNRRRCRWCSRGAHQVRASYAVGWRALENPIESKTTRG